MPQVTAVPEWVEEAHDALPRLVCLVAYSAICSYGGNLLPIVVLSFGMFGFVVFGLSGYSGKQQLSSGTARPVQVMSPLHAKEAHNCRKEYERNQHRNQQREDDKEKSHGEQLRPGIRSAEKKQSAACKEDGHESDRQVG